MNYDAMNLENTILAADPNNIFDDGNYIPYILEKDNSKKAKRMAKTEAIQARRLATIANQFNLEKDVARSHSTKVHNKNSAEAIAVAKGKQRDHMTYGHLDFCNDGCAGNRILSKESKGEIAGWKCPTKRSKTTNMSVVAAEALEELKQDIADEENITVAAIELDRKLEREAIIDDINNMADETLTKMRNEWEETAVSIATIFMKLKAVL